ncbi:hypothetical protein EVG20_g1430 [Dentipellis fragilis]|uniref:Uncharacterized protein n=1 Tax=Dentipellis fragilis TaxID=205917 RepID=A0A4Y9ZAV5_9AGAM|nr:hypothetical protein EVG20_g1430 [Dentipellis fragilis]
MEQTLHAALGRFAGSVTEIGTSLLDAMLPVLLSTIGLLLSIINLFRTVLVSVLRILQSVVQLGLDVFPEGVAGYSMGRNEQEPVNRYRLTAMAASQGPARRTPVALAHLFNSASSNDDAVLDIPVRQYVKPPNHHDLIQTIRRLFGSIPHKFEVTVMMPDRSIAPFRGHTYFKKVEVDGASWSAVCPSIDAVEIVTPSYYGLYDRD